MNWYKRQTKARKSAIVLLVCFIGALIAGILIWGLNVFISFFASLVSSSGLNAGGGIYIHHGLIGLIIFALSFFGIWWNWNDKRLVLIIALVGFIGFILMVHDAFAYSDNLWDWITFSHG